MSELYEFPAGHVGRKSYVGVRGHSKSVPKFKTYRGADGYNHLLPEYGGNWDGLGNQSTFIMPDKDGYQSPMDGKFVEGRAAHREHMKRHNVLEAGDMTMGSYGTRDTNIGGLRDDLRGAFSEQRLRSR